MVSQSVAKDISTVLVIGALIGSFKSLPVSVITYVARPSSRWQVIIGTILVSSLFEIFIYYQLLIVPLPFS
jgi:hypothetical protein